MIRGGKRVVMVAAVAANGVIGLDGGVPWHLTEDLRHFKALTTGNTLVMGRRTYESIGRALPDRVTVVVTRDPDWSAPGVTTVRSVEDGIARAHQLAGDVMIGGGAGIYAAAMPYATHQVLTEVDRSPDGDTFYPDFDRDQWRESRREDHDGFAFVWWERVRADAAPSR